MLTPLLLGLTLAMPATGGTTILQVDASTSFEYRDTFGLTGVDQGSFGSSHGRDLRGAADGGLTLYGKNIVDDDAAPSLQPFLQYATRMHVGGGGAYDDRELPGLGGDSPLTQGWVDAWADGYYNRWLYLSTRFEYDYDTWKLDGLGAESEQLERFSAALGVRFGDVRLSAGWGGTAFGIGARRATVRFWGGAFADAYAVIGRRIELDGGVQVAEGGAEAHLSATWWLGRRLGLSLGASGGAHAYVDSPERYSFAGGNVGVS